MAESDAELRSKLQEFVDSTTAILPDVKEAFCGQLVARIRKDLEELPNLASGEEKEARSELFKLLLTTARIFLREPPGCAQLLDESSFLLVLLQILNFPRTPSPSPSFSSPSAASSSSASSSSSSSSSSHSRSPLALEVQPSAFAPAICDETAKVICNLLTHREQYIELLADEFSIVDRIVATIQAPDTDRSLADTLIRVLLRLSPNRAVRESMLSVSILSIISEFLQRQLARIEEEQVRPQVVDAMGLLVNITMPLGPLNSVPRLPTSEEFEVYKSLVAIFQAYLFLPRDGPRFDRLRAQTVSCLINVPAACTELFDPERTLEALLYILSVQVRVAEETGDHSGALLSVLLVLTSIAKAIPRARQIIKRTIFPAELVDPGTTTADGVNIPVEVRESGCIASKIIPLMCSLSEGLKMYASEFLYEVCDEDSNELIRLAGFGYSAGLLAMRGLFNPQSVSNVRTRQYNPEEEAAAQPSGPPPQELLNLMQRLEEKGLLKVVTKDGSRFDYDQAKEDD